MTFVPIQGTYFPSQFTILGFEDLGLGFGKELSAYPCVPVLTLGTS